MTTEGIDYSKGGPLTSAQIKAAGKHFVGRYCVNDHSPDGRGISASEYANLVAGGTDVFVYWESSEGWMRGGFAAGAQAAVNAQQNLNAAGMPLMPVYFACDYDAPPEDQPLIDDCLQGCAEVLGIDRVGLYAGYYVLARAKQNGTARWRCQTIAWSRDANGNPLLLNGVHLYQFDTSGNFIAGVDVDLVRAYQENYGQASKFIAAPKPEHLYEQPLPVPFEEGDYGWKQLNGVPFFLLEAEVEVVRATRPKAYAEGDAPDAGPKVKKGERFKVIASGANRNDKKQLTRWLIRASDNARISGSACKPILPYQP